MSRHKPVSRFLWQASQKSTLFQWSKKNLKLERAEMEMSMLPLLTQHTKQYSADSSILEIGCGPVCISHSLPHKHKTYLDPLIDDFRRMFPGELPEDGEQLACNAERINKESNSYDIVICLNTLSFSMNPELIVNEVERLLKPGGIFIVEMRTHSALEARLHYWLLRFLPRITRSPRPYYYSLKGIRKTLERHFYINSEQKLKKQILWLPFFKREQRLFVCTPQRKKAVAKSDL
ncbi:bifunctional 3-demethylubiquinone-9 3-methyltransferase/ 2-octaprenyl-6-hydroxy phenol methylase [Mariprofundus micogutta]|uniref:Bifunctional 3-demethylubiquinone-9 3-methyltransferase/ 2-octaprenyl-6-hydroxy phenol methylase n=1 Tax=Mariprofundus micogutta TaxID=1921010 RepID=A0A1L8CN23_9PROT|nr:methyltransferase domain-containing protein [Mariprofundus micogutta]GAV20293.1 bifunctional 3-demethylubiquinone-9 3-methyltransferase/ 2-octaprenyl-6-hydroxy phenol methylase [Mariprofundus micogutta]